MNPRRVPRKEHLHREPLVCDGNGSDQEENVLAFASAGAEWAELITDYLLKHPGSSRLAVLLHILPDFLAFPAERRGLAWHWVTAQLQRMEANGELACTSDEKGMALWSVFESSMTRATKAWRENSAA